MQKIDWDDFADAEGRTYTIRSEFGDLSLMLRKAQLFDGPGRPGGSFRLEFLGPCEPVLPQNIHRFESDGEPLEIFVVPISRDNDGTVYEAIFN